MGVAERKERERQRREKEIMDAAEEVFIEKGFDAMTMDEVAKRADFTKRTVYAYFPGKEDLACAIVTRAVSHLNDIFERAVSEPGTGFGKIEATGFAFIQFAQSESKDFAVLCRNENGLCGYGRSPGFERLGREMQRQLEIMAGAIAMGIQDGSIKPDLDPEITAIHLATFSMAMMSAVRDREKDFLPRFGITTERYISQGMEFFSHALRSGTAPVASGAPR
jgi:AcrR family transcriptional regulator